MIPPGVACDRRGGSPQLGQGQAGASAPAIPVAEQKNAGGVLQYGTLSFMKWTLLVWIFPAGVSIALQAQTSDEVAAPKNKSYAVERTARKLPAPSPPQVLPSTNRPASNVKLTGFTTLGVSRAFFL